MVQDVAGTLGARGFIHLPLFSIYIDICIYIYIYISVCINIVVVLQELAFHPYLFCFFPLKQDIVEQAQQTQDGSFYPPPANPINPKP